MKLDGQLLSVDPLLLHSLLGDQNPAYPSGALLMMLLHEASQVSANGATFHPPVP